MVEKVESFSAKLERSLAPEGERSNHRCVEIDQSLALNLTTVRVAECVLRRNGVCRGIEPLRCRPVKPGKWVTYSVGAFIGVGIADIGDVLGINNGLILSVASVEDIVDLPVTKDVVA